MGGPQNVLQRLAMLAAASDRLFALPMVTNGSNVPKFDDGYIRHPCPGVPMGCYTNVRIACEVSNRTIRLYGARLLIFHKCRVYVPITRTKSK